MKPKNKPELFDLDSAIEDLDDLTTKRTVGRVRNLPVKNNPKDPKQIVKKTRGAPVDELAAIGAADRPLNSPIMPRATKPSG